MRLPLRRASSDISERDTRAAVFDKLKAFVTKGHRGSKPRSQRELLPL